jgi:hypothetical protein
MSDRNRVNETTISFNVFQGANRHIGVAQVTMPNISYKTQNISGSGIMGEYESVLIGQTDPMDFGLQFRGLSREVVNLMDFNSNVIELRPVVQKRTLGGIPELAGQKHVISGQVKSFNSGTIAPNSTQDVNVTLAVTRWEAFEEGRSMLEIDKLNYIHRVNGVDQMAALRRKMGGN